MGCCIIENPEGAGRIAKGGRCVTEAAVVAVALLSLVLLLRSFLAAGTGVLAELNWAVFGADNRGLLSELSELMSGRKRSLGSASAQYHEPSTLPLPLPDHM